MVLVKTRWERRFGRTVYISTEMRRFAFCVAPADICGYPTAEIVTGKHGFLYLPNVEDERLRRKQTRDGFMYRLTLPATGEYDVARIACENDE